MLWGAESFFAAIAWRSGKGRDGIGGSTEDERGTQGRAEGERGESERERERPKGTVVKRRGGEGP